MHSHFSFLTIFQTLDFWHNKKVKVEVIVVTPEIFPLLPVEYQG